MWVILPLSLSFLVYLDRLPQRGFESYNIKINKISKRQRKVEEAGLKTFR